MSESMIELVSERAQLRVDVARGGRLASLRVDDVELIIDELFPFGEGIASDDPVTWGFYPMVPFAGRIDRGRFTFDDVDYEVPTNLPPHALHGYGLSSVWTKVDGNTISFELADPWPFRGTVEQRFDLSNDRLVLTMSATAIDRQPMQFGWHPWWRRSTEAGELELRFSAKTMYRRGPNGLPDRTQIPPPPGPWDDCFIDLESDPVLRWGDLEVTLRSSADHWVVYDEPTHALCVEAQSGPPNAINDVPFVLDAGETLSHTFSLGWGTT